MTSIIKYVLEVTTFELLRLENIDSGDPTLGSILKILAACQLDGSAYFLFSLFKHMNVFSHWI